MSSSKTHYTTEELQVMARTWIAIGRDEVSNQLNLKNQLLSTKIIAQRTVIINQDRIIQENTAKKCGSKNNWIDRPSAQQIRFTAQDRIIEDQGNKAKERDLVLKATMSELLELKRKVRGLEGDMAVMKETAKRDLEGQKVLTERRQAELEVASRRFRMAEAALKAAMACDADVEVPVKVERGNEENQEPGSVSVDVKPTRECLARLDNQNSRDRMTTGRGESGKRRRM